MYTSILWESTGPGSLFSPACPSTSLFMVSGTPSLVSLSSPSSSANHFNSDNLFVLCTAAHLPVHHCIRSIQAQVVPLRGCRLGVSPPRFSLGKPLLSLFLTFISSLPFSFLISMQSLANLKGGSCAGSIVPIFIITVLTGIYSIATILRSNSIAKKE